LTSPGHLCPVLASPTRALAKVTEPGEPSREPAGPLSCPFTGVVTTEPEWSGSVVVGSVNPVPSALRLGPSVGGNSSRTNNPAAEADPRRRPPICPQQWQLEPDQIGCPRHKIDQLTSPPLGHQGNITPRTYCRLKHRVAESRWRTGPGSGCGGAGGAGGRLGVDGADAGQDRDADRGAGSGQGEAGC